MCVRNHEVVNLGPVPTNNPKPPTEKRISGCHNAHRRTERKEKKRLCTALTKDLFIKQTEKPNVMAPCGKTDPPRSCRNEVTANIIMFGLGLGETTKYSFSLLQYSKLIAVSMRLQVTIYTVCFYAIFYILLISILFHVACFFSISLYGVS